MDCLAISELMDQSEQMDFHGDTVMLWPRSYYAIAAKLQTVLPSYDLPASANTIGLLEIETYTF